MKVKFAFTLLLAAGFLFAESKSAAAPNPLQGYRLIRVSPREFASAISEAYSPPRKGQASNSPKASRLEKYFRIKSKKVSGKTVTLEIIPSVPLLGSLFPADDAITIATTLVKQTEDAYLYDVKFKAKVDAEATMLVEPHPLGSLITITADKTASSWGLSATLFKTMLAMGFLAEKPPTVISD